MTTSIEIKQKLHNYLEIADERKIKAIYTMMEEEIEDSLVEFTADLKVLLLKRKEDYRNGNVKMISRNESKKRVSKLLNKTLVK